LFIVAAGWRALKFSDFVDVRAICETGSLRKAAEALGITQPTLSMRIAHLEDQLGTPLFDRAHGRSMPTDLALFIARRAAAMADEADQLSREVTRLSTGKDGRVRIGLGPAITRVLVGPLAAAIKAHGPTISLELVSGPVNQLAESLFCCNLDVLVCEAPDAKPAALNMEPMLESAMVAVARPEHPLCGAPPTDLAGLLQYPIATSYVPETLLDYLRDAFGIDLDALADRVICSEYDMLVRAVAASPLLLAVGPRFTFAPELDAGTLTVIGTAMPFRNNLYLHTNRDAYPLPAVNKAQEIIRQLLGEMRDQQG
jgi:DNA-binding transcriptional LysR family regulator